MNRIEFAKRFAKLAEKNGRSLRRNRMEAHKQVRIASWMDSRSENGRLFTWAGDRAILLTA